MTLLLVKTARLIERAVPQLHNGEKLDRFWTRGELKVSTFRAVVGILGLISFRQLTSELSVASPRALEAV